MMTATAIGAGAGRWQEYVLTPAEAAVRPVAVAETGGDVEAPEALLGGGNRDTVLRYPTGGEKPYIILDFGASSVGGHAVFRVSSRKGTPVLRLAYANWLGACGERGDFERGSCTYLGVDLPILPANPGRFELYTLPRDGLYIAPLVQGQQRWVRVQLDTEGTEVALESIRIENRDVHDIGPHDGGFHCDDERINRVWYASTWTLQLASFPNHNAWTTLHGWLAPRKLEHGPDIGLFRDGADWTDGILSFDAEIRRNPDAVSAVGWAFRAQDADNAYVGSIDLEGFFTLAVRIAGNETILKRVRLTPAPVDGERHRIAVRLRGSRVTTFLDGREIDATVDETYASGRVGFRQRKEEWALVGGVRFSARDGSVLMRDDFEGDLSRWEFARTRAFVADGAKRDRLVWSGDLDWAGRNVYYAFRDASYMRESLKMLAFNRTPEGYIHAAPYPEIAVPPAAGDYGHFASDEFSAWFVPVAWDYLLFTGDSDTLREIFPAVDADVEYLLRYVASDGLFLQRHETSKHAENLNLGDTGKRTYMNILLWDSLVKGARIAREVERPEEAERWETLAAATRAAILRHLWDSERGCFRWSLEDARPAHAAGALALATGFLDGERAARLVPHLKHHSHGKFQSLTIRGKFEAGFPEEAMRDFFAHNWASIPERTDGTLTTTECMSIIRGGWGDESHPDTAVAHLFTGYLAGIRPLTPGFREFLVRPSLVHGVSRVQAVVPAPDGDIEVAAALEGNRYTLTLTSPPGTRATIAAPLPRTGGRTVTLDGAPVDLDEVAEGPVALLRGLEAGTHTVVVTAADGSFLPDIAGDARPVESQLPTLKLKARSSHETEDWGLSRAADGILRSVPGSKGYSSAGNPDPKAEEWLEIDLGGDAVIKSVVLHPRTDTPAAGGGTAGFPRDFSIEIMRDGAAYQPVKTVTDCPDPGGNPLEISLYTVVGFPSGRYLRLSVTRLGKPADDEPQTFRLQLAELEIKP